MHLAPGLLTRKHKKDQLLPKPISGKSRTFSRQLKKQMLHWCKHSNVTYPENKKGCLEMSAIITPLFSLSVIVAEVKLTPLCSAKALTTPPQVVSEGFLTHLRHISLASWKSLKAKWAKCQNSVRQNTTREPTHGNIYEQTTKPQLNLFLLSRKKDYRTKALLQKSYLTAWLHIIGGRQFTVPGRKSQPDNTTYFSCGKCIQTQ